MLDDELAHLEIDPDRIDLHHAGKLGRARIADQRTDTDEVARGDAVERRGHFRVAKIDVRDIEIGLRAQHIGIGFRKLGARVVKTRLRGELLLRQGLLPRELDLGVLLRGLVRLQRGFRLRELRLVGVLLDHEQQIALFDRGAIHIFDLLEEALHARFELDLGNRSHIAGELGIERHFLLERLGHHDLWWGRRNIGILLPARRESDQSDATPDELRGARPTTAPNAMLGRQRYDNHPTKSRFIEANQPHAFYSPTPKNHEWNRNIPIGCKTHFGVLSHPPVRPLSTGPPKMKPAGTSAPGGLSKHALNSRNKV